MAEPGVTRTVELTCRHLAVHTGPQWEDWLGDRTPCEVCGEERTIADIRWLPND